MIRRASRPAFTLIEVLIVVVIMAVLAATIIPQFSNSTDEARESSLKLNLHSLRSQLELYKMQHRGVAPTITSGSLPQLLLYTNETGATNATRTSSYPLGAYISGDLPVNPIGGSNTVTAAAANPPTAESGNGGWLYDAATGQIWADSDAYLAY